MAFFCIFAIKLTMQNYRIVCYDFETTGLDTSSCRPIEFAAIIINPDNTRTEVSFLIKNREIRKGVYERLDERVVEVTKITDEDLLLNGIEYDEAIRKIASVFDVENKLGLRTVIVGHNIIRYDNVILSRILSQAGFNFTINPKDVFDTGMEFRGKRLEVSDAGIVTHEYHKLVSSKGGAVKWNLTEACKHYGVPTLNDTHRALADVKYNIQVFEIQVDELRKRRVEQERDRRTAEQVNNQLTIFK